ncbi:right-handed parallel beta-helix repeat-containing protein [Candidatus Woesearchaeota archaeon]|nr:right-handed parallel beta-helix repeat-containing protein [Candidatus Woesearchaeota archaeon]
MKKGSAEITALTVLSILLVSTMFAALKDTKVTGLAAYENDSDYDAQSLCGGAVPCGCGDTVTSNWTMNSDLVCSGTALIIGDDDVAVDCNGYKYTGDKTGYGIYVNNYDQVTIRNCTATNFSHGIRLESSNNSLIEHNNVSNNADYGYGIYLSGSGNNNIKNNYAEYCYSGIYLTGSSNNNIRFNTIINDRSGEEYGIELVSSSGSNNITDNIVKNINAYAIEITTGCTQNNAIDNFVNNSFTGIYAILANSNNILSNNLTYNTYGLWSNRGHYMNASYNLATDNSIGIYLDRAQNCTVYSNTANDNANEGILIEGRADKNRIENNTAKGNFDGIKVLNSYYTEVIGNNCSNNAPDVGILLENGSHAVVMDNILFSNNEGARISNSTNCTLYNNEIKSHSQRGITIYNSTALNITSNLVENNWEGIRLSLSEGSNIANNLFNNSTREGVLIQSGSKLNTFENNNITFNGYNGIGLVSGSNNNTIFGNNLINNTKSGISLNNCNYTEVIGNTVENNTIWGIELQQSSGNLISENNLLNNNFNSVYGSVYLNSSSTDNRATLNNISHQTRADWNAVRIELSNNNNLTHNIINVDKHGFYLLNSNNTFLLNNTVYNCSDESIFDSSTNHETRIINNTIKDGLEDGIELGSNNSIAEGNIIQNNSVGIYLGGGNNNITANNISNSVNEGIDCNGNNNSITGNYIIDSGFYALDISGDDNLIYDNYVDNSDNVYAGGTGNNFNTTKTLGVNIIGKSWIGGNYWGNYRGQDVDGDWLGDTRIPHEGVDLLPLTYNSAAMLDIFELNSSHGANTTNENLTCWVNSTDADGDNVTYHGFWYLNGTEQVAELWNITQTNSGADVEGFSVAADKNNNLFVSGYKMSGGDKCRSIYKYNSLGQYIDSSVICGSDSEWYDISADYDDNIIAAGYLEVSSVPWFYVAKFNNSLSFPSLTFSTGSSSYVSIAQSVAVDSNDNVIVAGYSNKTGNYDFVVIKFDENLNEKWNKTFDFSGNQDYAMAVAVDSADSIIVTGRTENSTSNEFDFITVKYYANGTPAWNRTFNKSTGDRAYGVDVDSNDNIIVAGRKDGTGQDILIVMYNSTGSEQWNKTINGAGNEYARNVAVDSRNYIILGGFTTSLGAGQQDFYIIKLNSSGDNVWNYTFGGTDNDVLYGITTDNYDDVIAVGSTKSFPSASSTWNVLAVKYGGFESAEYEPSDLAAAGVLDYSETSVYDTWNCEIAIYDGNDYGFYNMSNSLTIIPDTAPQWSNNLTAPPSPYTYSPGQVYQFNVSWQNNIYVDTVYIEHNFTGPLDNYTVTDNAGDEYNYNVSDLAVGVYVWKEYANDTAGIWNETDQWTYEVQKAAPVCSITVNESEITYGQLVNVTCSCTGEGTAGLFKDNGSLIEDITSQVEQAIELPAGNYTFTCNTTETQNYTSATNSSDLINVSKAVSILSMTALPDWNITYGTESNVSCSANHNQAQINLTRNDSEMPIPDVQVLASGLYSYNCSMPESENYTSNETINILNVSKASSDINLAINGFEGDVESDISLIVNLTAFLVAGEGNITLYENTTLLNESYPLIEHLKNYTTAGEYNITANYSETENYSSSSVSYNLTIKDMSSPLWSNNITSPASGAVYSYNASYQFNVTWIDASSLVANVTIEHGFNGSLENYSVTENSSSEYYYNYSDLAAGTYIWSECANDTEGNLGCTDEFSYTVERASQTCSLSLNPSSMYDGETVNASCSCTGEGNAALYRNGTDVTSEIDHLVSLSTGTYLYVCNASQTQNYTSASDESTLTVSKKSSGGGGGAVSRCTSECTYGERECGAGNMVFVCGNYDSDICTEWDSFACAEDEKCEDGYCVSAVCAEDWICGEWSTCIGGYQTRDCFDSNSCGTYKSAPKTKIECGAEEKITEEEEVYIPPEAGIGPEEKEMAVEQQPIFTSTVIAQAVGLGAVGIGVILIIIGVISLAKGGLTGMVSRELDKGFPESRIKNDVMSRGYSQEEAGNIVRKEEIRKLTSIITANISHGFSIRDIKSELIAKGWKKEIVEEAVNNLVKKKP